MWEALLFLTVLAHDLPPEYVAVWQTLPERHRAHVRYVVVDRTSSAKAREATMSIHLPPYRNDEQARRSLTHELCHILAWSRRDLEEDWQAQFWPGGKAVGQPPSRYAASSQDEDWAVSCQQASVGRLADPDRDAFFRVRNIWP